MIFCSTKFIPLVRFAFLTFAVLAPGDARAGIVKVTSDPRCQYELSGIITPEDSLIIESLVRNDGTRLTICLNSPGGSFVGGRTLYEKFMAVGIATYVRNGDQCHSACALAFLGGSIWGDFRHPLRRLEPGGIVGFHAPSLMPGVQSYDASYVAETFRQTIMLVNQLIRDRESLKITEWFLTNFVLYDSPSTRPVTTIREAAHTGIDLIWSNDKITLSNSAIINACDLLFDLHEENFRDPNTAWLPLFEGEASEFSSHVNMGLIDIGNEKWVAIATKHSWGTPWETASCAFSPKPDYWGQYDVLMWSNSVGAAPDLSNAGKQLRLSIPQWYFLAKDTAISGM